MIYPRLKKLGVKVRVVNRVEFVRAGDLKRALRSRGLIVAFNGAFGVQTQSEFGPYPWDVEAVLERLASGKRTGSQLNWD